ncbi:MULTISPECIES: sugar transferase [unclassified Nocardioides]|uniref:sugar transferase n=1 Tax=unclassified Nocardioides TaxID=2615069 RepID=UPI001168C042|nr:MULTISPECIES: sugar transferase [unclassified Nocardioides]TQK71249.1 lipopolysaccharide/colanic/teichoic acid biosynthesis glycosyltransferase [Nocardioides sp. SLBN-35]WGY04584.1 sugar transferase [Nocardioides sp. QY071]
MSAQQATPDVVAVAATVDPAPVVVPFFEVHAHGRTRDLGEAVVALALLVVLLPAVILIALLVVGTSRGPVLFRQQRVGHGGRLFEVLKFRTMYADAEARAAEVFARGHDGSGPLTKLHVDPRVTPVGHWLRRLSLDELPQLWNVVNGTMSLVGPRPNTPTEVARFAPAEHRRHAVRPGMTGLAQINGRSDLEWDQAINLDLEYVDHHSLRMDLRILLRTLPAVFGGRGAY